MPFVRSWLRFSQSGSSGFSCRRAAAGCCQELETVLAEQESVKQESRTALDKAQQEAVAAREHAAGLVGQLEAVTAQNRELMAALKK